MGTRQVGIVGVLLMDLFLVSWITIAHGGVDALSPQLQEANPSIAAPLAVLPPQFEGNQDEVEDQVKLLPGGSGNTPGLMSSESVTVLSQQDPILPPDDRSEEFILALSFVPTRPDETSLVGNLLVLDPMVNTRPSSLLFEVVNEMRVRLK